MPILQEACREVHNSSAIGEPTPTGKAFKAWCAKYRERHPDRVGIPLRLQEQYWIRAAQKSEDGADLLQAINAVRANKGLKRVK